MHFPLISELSDDDALDGEEHLDINEDDIVILKDVSLDSSM